MTDTPSQSASRSVIDPPDSRRAELEREQAHVSMLYDCLDRSRAHARALLERAQRPDGGATPQALLDRDVTVAMHAERLMQLSAVERGLCIGHMGHEDGSTLYIGRLGLFDEEREPLLIDWRAPVAAPFYRATPAARGDVVRRRHLQTRGRLVTGFHDDVLDLEAVGAAEAGSLGGDAALLASLNARRTGRMTDIVATIQAEQDHVIRADLPGILVVQGGPGTGKTAVALHRAAYLLYTHRDRLGGRGVLVVGPNPTFLRYIQQVLPSLGETDVLLSTLDQLYPGVAATGREPAEVATLKGDRRMVEVLAAAVRDRQRVPSDPLDFEIAFAANDRAMAIRVDPAAVAQARDAARDTHLPHNQARAIFVREVVTALYDAITGLARDEAERIDAQTREIDELVDDSVFGPDEQLYNGPVLSGEQIDDLRGDIWAGFAPLVHAALRELWPQLTPERLLTELYTTPSRLAVAAAALSDAERALLARKAPPGPSGIATPEDDWWTAADIPLLDEAAELLGEDDRAARKAEARRAEAAERDLAYARGVLNIVDVDGSVVDAELLAGRYRHREERAPLAERARQDRTWLFGHAIVDEAQELSAMSWRMLIRRCPSRSMTVVGDLAQTGSPGGARSWAAALDPDAGGRWRAGELTVNYRTPAEIMAVAADVLASVAPHLTPPTSVREAGVPPWHLRLDPADLAKRLPGIVEAEAAAVSGGRVAVIVPIDRGEELGEQLAAALPDAAAHGPDALDAPVAILSVAEAKGLEFDGVVIVEPAIILAESPTGANNLYVALTRATQRLGVVHTGDLPPSLARLEPHPDG